MGRRPKPYWWEEKQAYYCTIDKVRHRLGTDKKAADTRFYKLMSAPPTAVSQDTVWGIFDAFLDWTLANKAKRTYDFYRERLQRFKDAVPNAAVERLTPQHVYDWLNDKTWSNNYKRGVITSLCRAFNWAVKARMIAFNPIKGIEKPSETHREQIITPAQFKQILARVKDEPFHDLLEVVWFTGCRPQEIAKVEAKHFGDGFWKFPKQDSKGKKRERQVFLTDEAFKICKKWAKRNPDGPIFRNNQGRPWTAFAFNNRFTDLQIASGKKELEVRGFDITDEQIAAKVMTLKPRKLDHGIEKDKSPSELRSEARRKLITCEAMKHGTKVCMYAIRHSYAHHGLTKGKLDPLTMATLLGHSNTNMLMKVYGHLLKDTKFMREAAKRATRR